MPSTPPSGTIQLTDKAVPLPDFVRRLLGQTRAPDDIPRIAQEEAADWLLPLTEALLSWLRERESDAPCGVFLGHHCAHIPLPSADGKGLFLRVPLRSTWTAWPIDTTTVVLVVAGEVDVEVYPNQEDLRMGHPQYARSFGPEEVFATHVGTVCALRSRSTSLQVLATPRPGRDSTGIRPLPNASALYEQAERSLERILDGAR
ncbi:hypothetical protein [Streptacidiphilus sp. MAP5-3]|uniref:hypothetical protein n=1 Tax=unclassified Streptacidiphilus TaxID=2643834 RepID=UPI0035198444